MATTKADDEGLPHLWEERRSEQQLTQASFAEITQEAVIRERGQCHDYGNSKGFDGAQN